jgi:hypothetical protein
LFKRDLWIYIFSRRDSWEKAVHYNVDQIYKYILYVCLSDPTLEFSVVAIGNDNVLSGRCRLLFIYWNYVLYNCFARMTLTTDCHSCISACHTPVHYNVDQIYKYILYVCLSDPTLEFSVVASILNELHNYVLLWFMCDHAHVVHMWVKY